MRRVAVLILAIWAVSLAGCNTVEGVGKDIKKAGQSIEKAAQ